MASDKGPRYRADECPRAGYAASTIQCFVRSLRSGEYTLSTSVVRGIPTRWPFVGSTEDPETVARWARRMRASGRRGRREEGASSLEKGDGPEVDVGGCKVRRILSRSV